MTIQTINIGTTPDDNTGDDPRTAGQKLNSNFTTSSHAASRDVGTASGNIPDADGLNMVGATENYTSNNLNPNVFGGLAADDIVSQTMYASSTANAVVINPLVSTAAPVSITVTSTFKILSADGTVVRTGITGADIALFSGSSNKIAQILITNNTGLSTGSNYTLRTETASSKITVNF